MPWGRASLICAMLAVAGCRLPTESSFTVSPLAAPMLSDSGEPDLHAGADGEIYLSWTDRGEGKRHALRFATLQGQAWSGPKTIASGEDWFVNWADFPSLVLLKHGVLAAHWLQKSGPGAYAYDVNLTFSRDAGHEWSAPITPHRDHTPTQHGFVSLLPWVDSQLLAVWLDGRNVEPDEEEGDISLRAALLDERGEILQETELDARTCSCCQTAAGLLPGGAAIVAYRDRSELEVRDISVVRYEHGRWTDPQTIHADGWKINACPVNGPALATQGQHVAVAWFTGTGNRPQVYASLSNDGGRRFGAPIRIDSGSSLGRVDVVVLPDGTAVISWLEYVPTRGAAIRLRRIGPAGSLGQTHTVAAMASAHASGFPRLARVRDTLVMAWTQTDPKPRVMTALIKLPLS